MSRSLKKGPFVDEKLMKKVKTMIDSGEKEAYKDMVKTFNNSTGLYRIYLCCS